MAELKTRVDELKMENEYQLRLKDMNYNEKIKELTEKFIQEMESLKTKNQVLKTEKDKEEAKHEEELGELMEKHAKELQDLGKYDLALDQILFLFRVIEMLVKYLKFRGSELFVHMGHRKIFSFLHVYMSFYLFPFSFKLNDVLVFVMLRVCKQPEVDAGI